MSKPIHQSAGSVLQLSMNASAKLAGRARRMLEAELKAMEKELRNPSLPPLRRTDLIETITSIIAVLDRSCENAAKLLTAKHAPAIPSDNPTPQDVLDEIVRGQPARGADRK